MTERESGVAVPTGGGAGPSSWRQRVERALTLGRSVFSGESRLVSRHGSVSRHLALVDPEALEFDLSDPAQRQFGDYELLLFDDGSTDRTGAIMEELAAADPRHVQVIHNATPRNLGGVYKQGIELARME